MIASLAALLLATSPCVAPPLRSGIEPLGKAGSAPFRTGEELSYDVDILGMVKAGTVTLAVEPAMSHGSILPLRARVRTTSTLTQGHRVRGFALSWIDTHTLRPQRYRDDVEEDGVHKNTDTRLDRPGPLVMNWKFGDKKGSTSAARSAEVFDLLSAIYYLRAATLHPGDPICFDLVANRRFWKLKGAVATGQERVESAAGSFDTFRFDADLTRADGNGPNRQVHIWFSKDARRLPIAVVSEIDIGPVRAMLARFSAPAATTTSN